MKLDGKKLILGPILAQLTKNLASPVTRYQCQLSSCTISEETNDPILRKFSDGRTDRQERFYKTLSD